MDIDENENRTRVGRFKALLDHHRSTTINVEIQALYDWVREALSFFDGEWQWVMPQREGKFWVCTRGGEITGPITVVKHPAGFFYCPEHSVYDTLVGYGRAVGPGTTWSGMWWSKPLPTPPKNTKI